MDQERIQEIQATIRHLEAQRDCPAVEEMLTDLEYALSSVSSAVDYLEEVSRQAQKLGLSEIADRIKGAAADISWDAQACADGIEEEAYEAHGSPEIDAQVEMWEERLEDLYRGEEPTWFDDDEDYTPSSDHPSLPGMEDTDGQ